MKALLFAVVMAGCVSERPHLMGCDAWCADAKYPDACFKNCRAEVARYEAKTGIRPKILSSAELQAQAEDQQRKSGSVCRVELCAKVSALLGDLKFRKVCFEAMVPGDKAKADTELVSETVNMGSEHITVTVGKVNMCL